MIFEKLYKTSNYVIPVIGDYKLSFPRRRESRKKILKLLNAGYPEGHAIKSGMTKVLDLDLFGHDKNWAKSQSTPSYRRRPVSRTY
jgi:hypothetical protein